MSVVSDAVGGFVNGILGSPLLTHLADLIPDPAAKAKALMDFQLSLMDYASKSDLAQLAVDAEEAKNENIFVSGWRPFIGWTCGAAFAYQFILQPMATFLIMVSGSSFDPHRLPTLDWGAMSTVLLGMLGLGGLRTIEKVKGV